MIKLLQGDRQALSLLRNTPFPDAPPRHVRARYYLYRYGKEKWWDRELVGDYLVPISLEHPVLKLVLARYEKSL